MIPFVYGTQEQYDAQVKNNSAIYFISDTKRVYRGEELIAGVQALVVQDLPTFEAAIEGVLYVVVDGETAHIYAKGEKELVSISGSVGDKDIFGLGAFADGVILTSVDDIDKADDSNLFTAGAVKTAIENATGTWTYLDGVEDVSKIYG